jgi:hypothetical protein
LLFELTSIYLKSGGERLIFLKPLLDILGGDLFGPLNPLL